MFETNLIKKPINIFVLIVDPAIFSIASEKKKNSKKRGHLNVCLVDY